MSLRVRLIVAFFLLSVVPLAALTLYGYSSSAKALREVARRDAEVLAGELTQRMQIVTAQLSDRVEYLMGLADAAATANTAVLKTQAQASEAVSSAAVSSATSASETLGSIAMLLNNVELRDNFGRGRRGGGRLGGGPGGQGGSAGGRSGFGRNGGRGAPPPGEGTAAAPTPGSAPVATAVPGTPARGAGAQGPGTGAPGAAPSPPTPPAAPGAPPAPGGAPPALSRAADAVDRITIDMMPIRREILQQYASQEEFAKLPPAEQERIIGEVNQRMLGIQAGIRMGTAEAQRRIAEAQRAAEAKAKEAAAAAVPAPAPVAPTTPLQRRATLSGSRLAVTMVRNGEVVRQANADVDLPSLLGTVFSTTRRDRGEVPFAVSKDGQVHTPTTADRLKIASIGRGVTDVNAPIGTAVFPDWIVVTSADPTGSGLKFGIARPVGDSLSELRRTAARNAVFGFAFIGLALVGIVPLSGRLTRDLSTLSEGVRRIAAGDYRARVELQANDEIGKLARAFNQMAADVEQHQRAAVGQERIRRELELGRQIQHDMLPRSPLVLGLTEVQGVSVPAREVGGDFFNYFRLPSGQIALLVGDVSGKGVGAALLMANIQASLRTRLALGQDLASIAREIDSDVDANTPGSVYATLFLAMLDVEAHELRYVNAGHNPQYVLRGGGGLDHMASTGMPVGLLSGHGYVEHRLEVAPGDVLFFYTDGCVECENEAGEEFGAERLEALLSGHAASGVDEVLASVEKSIATFRGTREPLDDATMMVVKVG